GPYRDSRTPRRDRAVAAGAGWRGTGAASQHAGRGGRMHRDRPGDQARLTMFTVAFERYTLLCLPDGLPDLYADYAGHSRLADEVNLSSPEGKACFVAVREGM